MNDSITSIECARVSGGCLILIGNRLSKIFGFVFMSRSTARGFEKSSRELAAIKSIYKLKGGQSQLSQDHFALYESGEKVGG